MIDRNGNHLDLVTPTMTNGEPSAGKRVRQVAPEYKGTDVYHALYLPVDWKPAGHYPVIVELRATNGIRAGRRGRRKVPTWATV